MATRQSTKATDQLRQEHEAIRQMLRVLDAACHRLDRGDDIDPGDFERILEFFRAFSDRCHHAKEEEMLFPALERAGVPREGGPIGVMLHEHEQGRQFLRAMAHGVAGLRAGDAGASEQLIAAARGYIQMLEQHIRKENEVLFPIAEDRFSGEQQDDLAEQFDRFEGDRMGHGRHEELHRVMDELRAKYIRE